MRDLSLLHLRALAADFPADPEVHFEFVHRLRLAGARDEARRASVSFQLLHPTLAEPRIQLLRAYRDEGDAARVQREVELFLRDFADNGAALLALADFAATTGDRPLAGHLLQHARTHHLPWEAHALLEAEATMVAHDYREAVELIRTLIAANPDWGNRHRPLLDSLLSLAYRGLGEADASRLALTHFLNQPSLRAENLVALANRFAALGADGQARQILTRALSADPLNQAALSRLVEFDLNLNRTDELPEHLRRLLALRQPSPDILRLARQKLSSDSFPSSVDRDELLGTIRVALEKHGPTGAR